MLQELLIGRPGFSPKDSMALWAHVPMDQGHSELSRNLGQEQKSPCLSICPGVIPSFSLAPREAERVITPQPWLVSNRNEKSLLLQNLPSLPEPHHSSACRRACKRGGRGCLRLWVLNSLALLTILGSPCRTEYQFH